MADRDAWLYNLTRELIQGMGFTLVDAREARRDGRRLLQFYIDDPKGVSVEDCAGVSRELSYLLDAEPELDDGYVLEVSSPGLDHDLRREREYRHFSGRRARLVVRGAEARGGAVVGTIVTAEDDSVVLDADDGERLTLPVSDIVRARLVIEDL